MCPVCKDGVKLNFTMSDVVACTCNQATLEAEFENGVGSITFGGNSPLIGGRILTKYRNLTET